MSEGDRTPHAGELAIHLLTWLPGIPFTGPACPRRERRGEVGRRRPSSRRDSNRSVSTTDTDHTGATKECDARRTDPQGHRVAPRLGIAGSAPIRDLLFCAACYRPFSPSAQDAHVVEETPVTVQTLRSTTLARLRRITAPKNRDEPLELPLRAELFLIGHHDHTGQLHINQRLLQRGLAATVLYDLQLDDKIQIGWRPDARHATWQPEPGHITVLDPNPTGDPITDDALTKLWRREIPNTIHDFIHQYATPDLYERTRADLIATGLLHRTSHTRFGLFRRDVHQPVDEAHPYQIRGTIRRAAATYRPDNPDYRALAQVGLITALGLTPHLYPTDMPTSRLQERFHQITTSRPAHTILDVARAINPRRTRRAFVVRD